MDNEAQGQLDKIWNLNLVYLVRYFSFFFIARMENRDFSLQITKTKKFYLQVSKSENSHSKTLCLQVINRLVTFARKTFLIDFKFMFYWNKTYDK